MPTSVKSAWFKILTSICTTCKKGFTHIEFDNQQRVCPRCMNKESIDNEK